MIIMKDPVLDIDLWHFLSEKYHSFLQQILDNSQISFLIENGLMVLCYE